MCLDLSPFLAQLVKTRFSANGENASWECHAGRSRGSSSWLPFGGWRQVFRWPKYRVAWRCEPNLLDRWRREFRQAPGNAFPGNGQRRWSEGKIAELERKIGRQAVEIDFLKGCCGYGRQPRHRSTT